MNESMHEIEKTIEDYDYYIHSDGKTVENRPGIIQSRIQPFYNRYYRKHPKSRRKPIRIISSILFGMFILNAASVFLVWSLSKTNTSTEPVTQDNEIKSNGDLSESETFDMDNPPAVETTDTNVPLAESIVSTTVNADVESMATSEKAEETTAERDIVTLPAGETSEYSQSDTVIKEYDTDTIVSENENLDTTQMDSSATSTQKAKSVIESIPVDQDADIHFLESIPIFPETISTGTYNFDLYLPENPHWEYVKQIEYDGLIYNYYEVPNALIYIGCGINLSKQEIITKTGYDWGVAFSSSDTYCYSDILGDVLLCFFPAPTSVRGYHFQYPSDNITYDITIRLASDRYYFSNGEKTRHVYLTEFNPSEGTFSYNCTKSLTRRLALLYA